jgi:hypothetical protein
MKQKPNYERDYNSVVEDYCFSDLYQAAKEFNTMWD